MRRLALVAVSLFFACKAPGGQAPSGAAEGQPAGDGISFASSSAGKTSSAASPERWAGKASSPTPRETPSGQASSLSPAEPTADTTSSPAPAVPAAVAAASPTPTRPSGGEEVVLDHVLETLEGEPFPLAALRGKVLLIVNVASKCGYTPQYAGLQKLHETYGPRGLVVIGIPSNDFGGQEPGTAEEIRAFCENEYGVTFPMMAKVHARGPNIAPLYAALTQKTRPPIAGEVKWNFTKFLVDRRGVPVARFEPKVDPLSDEIVRMIEELLGEG